MPGASEKIADETEEEARKVEEAGTDGKEEEQDTRRKTLREQKEEAEGK